MYKNVNVAVLSPLKVDQMGRATSKLGEVKDETPF